MHFNALWCTYDHLIVYEKILQDGAHKFHLISWNNAAGQGENNAQIACFLKKIRVISPLSAKT